VLLAAAAQAAPVTPLPVYSHVDWTSAGVGGVGDGAGIISLGNVDGPVRLALLYWHGIDQPQAGGDGVYDNENIAFAGQPIVGTPIGDSGPNCWPTQEDATGSSRSFRADVTALVTGNGRYTLSGLSAKRGHSANGASLIVFFDDGHVEDDRDVVVFDGNDSNVADLPSEDDGWHAVLNGILYSGGTVNAQFHVADGQTLPDNTVTFTSTEGEVAIQDSVTLWDGQSVTNAGHSRAGDGALWDIHTIDVTEAFSAHGMYSLSMDGQELVGTNDCLGLVVLLLDFPAGSVPPTTTTTSTTTTTTSVPTTIPPNPCGNGTVDAGEQCDLGAATNGAPGVCCSAACTLLPAGQECRPAADACDLAETCSGSTADCPADSRRNVGDVCDDGDPETGISSCNAAQQCTGVSTMVTLEPTIPVPARKNAKRVRIPLTMQLAEPGSQRAAVQAQGLVSCLDLPADLRPAQCASRSRAGGGHAAGLESVFLPVTPRIRRSLGVTRSTAIPVRLPLTPLGRRLFAQLGFNPGGLTVRVRCLLRDRQGREIDVTAPTSLQRQR
jgi:hypothetical protein